MFLRGLLVFLWFAWAVEGLPAAGVVLRGVVLTNYIAEPTLEGVFVDAPGATRSKTDEDGRFSLEFPDRQPGDLVSLTVEKEGYAVVNFVQLEAQLPEDGENASFFVLLCKAGDREEAAHAFYHAKTEKVIDAEWDKRITAAESAGTAAVEKLRREYLQASAVAGSADWKLAAIRPGENSFLFRRAMRLFLEGNAYAAILHLDNGALRAAVVEAGANEETNPEALVENAIQPWLLKAHLYTIQLQFAEAEATYQTAIDAVPDSYELSNSLAFFHRNLDRPAKAIAAYQRCVTLAKMWGRYADLGVTLNDLGMLYEGQHDLAAARSAFEESTRTLRKVAITQPESNLPKLAIALYNQGRLSEDEKRLGDAESEYKECLETQRALAKTAPETYLPDVAVTLNDLADVFTKQERKTAARDAVAEAVKIYRDLARSDSETYSVKLARMLYRLGVQHNDESRLEEAQSDFAEALENFRDLARADSETYLPDVALSLSYLALVHREEGRDGEVREALDESVKVYRDLARTHPKDHLPSLAAQLWNLGRLNEEEKQFVAAESDYVECLGIRRELARADAETYLPDVAQTLSDLADVLDKQERSEEARDALDEAVQLYRKLGNTRPEEYQPKLAYVLSHLGVLHGNERKFETAYPEIEEALRIYRDLAQADSDYYADFISRLSDYLERLKQ